jgi:enoyl-CoA hydratase
LVQLIGKGRAMELILSGNMMDAEEAYRIGLVNHLYPVEDLLDKTKSLLQIILSKAPLALAASIKAINASQNKGDDGYEVESNEFGQCFATEDMKEGTAAFLEKRKPLFKGN